MIPEDYTESFKALDRAADALESARHNLNGKFYTATANRAYYACYYCIISLLYTKGIYSKTHQGARSKFSELFIKPATFPIRLAASIATLYDFRQEADYDLDADITEQEAEFLIEKANELYVLTSSYLAQLSAE